MSETEENAPATGTPAAEAPGAELAVRPPARQSLPAKIQYAKLLADSGLLTKVAAGYGGCWIWTGTRTNGYGITSVDGRSARAHRVAYLLAYGSIPEDTPHLDHLCRVRACIRPDHLEPVTQAENNRRAGEARTHCPNGHELAPRVPGMRRRECPTCKTEYDRERYAISRVGVQSRANADRTACPAGHAYDEQNTYLTPEGKRSCRECRNQASRRYRAGKAAS